MAMIWTRPEKLRPRVTAGVARQRFLSAQTPQAPFTSNVDVST
jgi:hypothetical protein